MSLPTPPWVLAEEARWIPTTVSVSVPQAGSYEVEISSSAPLPPSWSVQAIANNGAAFFEHKADACAKIVVAVQPMQAPSIFTVSVWVKRHSPQPRTAFRATVTSLGRTGRNLYGLSDVLSHLGRSPSPVLRGRSPQHTRSVLQNITIQAALRATVQKKLDAQLRKVLGLIEFVFRLDDERASLQGKEKESARKEKQAQLLTYAGTILYTILSLARLAALLSRSALTCLRAANSFAIAVRASNSAFAVTGEKNADLMREQGRMMVCEVQNLVAADRASKSMEGETRIMRLQRLVRSWLAWLHVSRFAEAFAEKDHTERRKILREFSDSEAAYHGSLNALSIYFYNPMIANCVGMGMPERDVNKIFGNLRSLITLSKEVKECLERGIEAWPAIYRIGALFVRLGPTFKIFSQFAAEYSVALSTLNTARTRYPLQELLRACMTKSGSSLSIEDYLIMPVQRMPRYELLLSSLIAATSLRHPDYVALKDALASIKSLNRFIDTKRGERDASTRLGALATRLPAISVAVFAPTRSALLTATVYITLTPVSSSPSHKLKPRELFLMSDCLIILSMRKLHHLWLHTTVHDPVPCDSKDEAGMVIFGVRFLAAPSHEPARVCVAYWSRKGEREEWLGAMKNAIQPKP